MKSVVAASVALIGISSGAAYAADGYANDNGGTVIKNNLRQNAGALARGPEETPPKNDDLATCCHRKPVAAPAPALAAGEGSTETRFVPPPPAPKYEKLTLPCGSLFAFNEQPQAVGQGKKELADLLTKLRQKKLH